MKAPRGYIAIVSAIIISAIMAMVVFSSSTGLFIARFGQLDSEDKMRSKVLALSCMYEALYAYAEDASYSPHDQAINIGQRENGIAEDCVIQSITSSDSRLSIIVRASMQDSYTALEVTAVTNPLSVTSWYEITSIPP